MNIDDWLPVQRNTILYSNELEKFVVRFLGDPEPEYSQLYDEVAYAIAQRMVRRVDVANEKSWRAAAHKAMHGRRIYQALRTEMGSAIGMRVDELVEANARLIRTLPAKISQKVTAHIAREQRRGSRAAEIEQQLIHKLPTLTRKQVRLIARTEVGKAETALTRARSERLGLRFYQWATSKDQRVRPSHRLMSEVLVHWDDAPSPEQLAGERSTLGHYHAGSAPNCRCITLPLVSLDEVRWPAKVYSHGQISYVARGVFERWIRVPAAA